MTISDCISKIVPGDRVILYHNLNMWIDRKSLPRVKSDLNLIKHVALVGSINEVMLSIDRRITFVSPTPYFNYTKMLDIYTMLFVGNDWIHKIIKTPSRKSLKKEEKI